MRPSAAWESDRQRRQFIFGNLVFVIAAAVNIALASLGYLQLLLLLALGTPAGIFAAAVADVTRGPDSDSGSDASAPRQS